MQTALTIAGSDSGGGAGIQADLRTFFAHGVFGLTAVTAVTAQNTLGLSGLLAIPPGMVVDQIDAVVTDLCPAATKIGMVANAAVVSAVAAAITRYGLQNVVLDTVMAATSGARLIDDGGIAALRRDLMPLAAVTTVNIPEAAALTGRPMETLADAREAARYLVGVGARAVVVKGGHLPGAPIDVFFDGRDMIELHGARLDTWHTHGTGCTFAAAIAAQLALGSSLADAVRAAKTYVATAIAAAPGLGQGHGPLGVGLVS